MSDQSKNRVAAIQMCSSASVEKNLNTAEELIKQAASHQAKLIVLPEMFAFMAQDPADKIAIKEPFGRGQIQSFLSHQAKQHQCWILGGTVPLSCDQESKVRAASLLFNNNGELAARYDKIHMFNVKVSETEIYRESDTIEPGDQVVVVQTPVGKLGLAVCYDVRFPEQFRQMHQQGAEIFALPSAFTVKTGSAHWDLLTRCRAVENFSFLIGAAQGGTHSTGRKTYGHSTIVNPWGDVLAKAEGVEPAVIYADIDLDTLYEYRNMFAND